MVVLLIDVHLSFAKNVQDCHRISFLPFSFLFLQINLMSEGFMAFVLQF